MKTNGNNTSSTNERFSENGKPILQREFTAESVRQRGSREFRPLVFCSATQSPNEIRNGTHTQEFYIRHGLLPKSSETK
jgi:hypothetical protein